MARRRARIDVRVHGDVPLHRGWRSIVERICGKRQLAQSPAGSRSDSLTRTAHLPVIQAGPMPQDSIVDSAVRIAITSWRLLRRACRVRPDPAWRRRRCRSGTAGTRRRRQRRSRRTRRRRLSDRRSAGAKVRSRPCRSAGHAGRQPAHRAPAGRVVTCAGAELRRAMQRRRSSGVGARRSGCRQRRAELQMHERHRAQSVRLQRTRPADGNCVKRP